VGVQEGVAADLGHDDAEDFDALGALPEVVELAQYLVCERVPDPLELQHAHHRLDDDAFVPRVCLIVHPALYLLQEVQRGLPILKSVFCSIYIYI